MCKETTPHYFTDLSLEIRLDRSKQLLSKWVDAYNDGRAKKEQIRAFHKSVVLRMIQMYWGNFNANVNTTMFALKKGTLPTLRTSNGALAKEFGVTKKTIWNARQRLADAGLVVYKCWHGTNAPYELWINPMVIYFADRKNPVKGFPYKANMNRLFFSSLMENLHHTVSGLYPVQVTIKGLNRKGEETPENVDNFSLTSEEGVPSKEHTQGTFETSNKPSKKNPATASMTTKQETAPPLAATPPADIPKTIEEVLAHLSKSHAAKVKMLATICFSHASATLYKDRWIHDSQKLAGIRGIAELMAWTCQPKNYDQFKKVIIERINIAHRFFEQKTLRKAMLPEYYFDMRNDTKESGGFGYTAVFYRKRLVQRYRQAREYKLTSAVQKYLKSIEPGSKIDRTVLHHELTQEIRKKYGAEYVLQFETRVNEAILTS